jgi:hypothetical protein
MGDIAVIIFLAAVIIIVSLVGKSVNERRRVIGELVRRSGEELGLKYRHGFSFAAPVASGYIEGLKVTLRHQASTEENSFSDLLRVYIAHRIDAGGILLVSRETEMTRMQKKFTGEDILTGDRAFDDTMLIGGSSPFRVSALMNEGLRKKLLDILRKSVMVNLTSSWFEVVFRHGSLGLEEIVAFVRETVAVSLDMTSGTDFRARLIGNIRNDSVPGVRALCIRHLAAHFPADGEITGLLRGALQDGDLPVRMEAALNLGFEGLEFLGRLIDEGKYFVEDDTLRIVKAFGDQRFRGGIPVLKKLFSQGAGETVLLAILKAFAAIGDTGLSGFLLDYANHPDYDVRRGVMDALGACGTVETVEPLLKILKSSLNPLFRSDVQKAVASIQSRLGGADAGWLSVTEVSGTDGALSLSGGAGEGALSGEGKMGKDGAE